MKPPDRIRIRLLGGVEVFRDDGISIPIRLSTKKVSALVAFLAMSRKQAATREELATLLWGSCSDQQARQSLRQAMVLLRKDLRSSQRAVRRQRSGPPAARLLVGRRA
jgi:DNA-binding SARP family transcriptional activator